MRDSQRRSYYRSRSDHSLDLYDTHSRAWRPSLARRCGDTFAEEVRQEARLPLITS
jgi:hypothetical protein